MTTAGLQMTHHADHRCAQHTAPDCVLELLRTGGGADFLGRHPNHPRVQLRIVRTADSYWIAPHANGTMVTIYEKDARDIDAWASKHLHHPEQTRIGCVACPSTSPRSRPSPPTCSRCGWRREASTESSRTGCDRS